MTQQQANKLRELVDAEIYNCIEPLSDRAIARECGVSNQTIANIRKGKPCDRGTCAKVCQWLNISIEELDK